MGIRCMFGLCKKGAKRVLKAAESRGHLFYLACVVLEGRGIISFVACGCLVVGFCCEVYDFVEERKAA